MNLCYEDIMANKTNAYGEPVPDKESIGIGEFWQLCALLFGAMSWLTRDKNCAWWCVISFAMAIINFRFNDMLKQLMTSATLVLMAFAQAYLFPEYERIN